MTTAASIEPERLTYASLLVQVHVGVGLLTLAGGGAIAKTAKAGASARWGQALVATAAATGEAPLLAVFALVQAAGAKQDGMTEFGLAASFFGMIVAALFAGLKLMAADEADDSAQGTASTIIRRLASSVRACGMTILVFGAIPSGFQLLCATAIMRIAILVHAMDAASYALQLGDVQLINNLERSVSHTTFIGALALLDHLAWGPSSVTYAPVQPLLYCTCATLALVFLAFVAGAFFGASVEDEAKPEFAINFHFDEADSGVNLEVFRRLAVGGLYTALGGATLRMLAGIFKLKANTQGFTVQWGQPLMAAAALLGAFIVKIYCAEYVFLVLLAKKKATNGFTNGDSTEAHEEKPTILDNTKAIVAPSITLVLALIIGQLSPMWFSVSNPWADDFEAKPLFGVPVGCGFLMVGPAVVLQVANLLFFALCNLDSGSECSPQFDGTGTVIWMPESKILSQVASNATLVIQVLMKLGLILGFWSMGIGYWIVGFLIAAPVLCFIAPKDICAGAWAAVSAMGPQATSGWSDARQSARQKQLAKEAEVAAQAFLEAEDDAPGSGRKEKQQASWKSAKKGPAGGFKKKGKN